MVGGQPFMYDPVPKESSRHPYSSFDPKAVSRASLTPKPPKPKQDGPLISFNQHPDSYLVLPYRDSTANAMSPSIKKKVKVTRIIQLILRCFELLGAIGLLGMMILITNVETITAWLMRIPPGFGILHTLYGIYHLSGRASRRPPASTASYMLFAACLDVSLIPFYAFGAVTTSAQYKLSFGGWSAWSTRLPPGQGLTTAFSGTAFLCSVIPASLHLISLVLSLWLAVTFRKITRLPPDMNPLEDNLTSRHKRNKSSISMTASTVSEKRLSEPLESKRSSGAPYEDVSRPPTIPFLQTRTGSVESFSTYHTTPPASRDGRLDLPSRQYQIPSSTTSPRSSVIDLKRSSFNYNAPISPPKRASYASLPLSEASSPRSSRQMGNMPEAWHTAESLPTSQRSSRNSPKKSAYQPLQQRPDVEDDISLTPPHPKPLEANPPTPRLPNNRSQRGSALSEISYNNGAGSNGDLSEVSLSTRYEQATKPPPRQRQQHQQQQPQQQENFKARFYGDLKSATPPILIGAQGSQRQVSSGNDFDNKGFRGFGRRDVSGKIAEEGRSVTGNSTWGTRFRKISGRT